MQSDLVFEIIKCEMSNAEIIKKFKISGAYISTVRNNLEYIKYKPVIKDNKLVCTKCKKEVENISFHHIHAVKYIIALVCQSCNLKLRQQDTIDDPNLEINPIWQSGEYSKVFLSKPAKSVYLSDDVLQDYSDVDHNIYPKLGRHLSWDEYIRLQNSNRKLREGLCDEIKKIVG